MTERTKQQQEIIARVLNNCDKRLLNEIIGKMEAKLNHYFDEHLLSTIKRRIPISKNLYFRNLKYGFTFNNRNEEIKVLYDLELTIRSGEFYIDLSLGVIDDQCKDEGLDMFKTESASFATECKLTCSFYTLAREIKRQYNRDRRAFDNTFKLFAPNHHRSIKGAMLQLANKSA